MCGRFALWLQNLEDEIAARYPFIEPRPYEPPEAEGGRENQPEFHPRYNVAPRSISPVVRRVEVDNHPGNVIQIMKWGVIPHWQKHESNNLSTINARSEALLDGESGLWSSLKGKRCVVPVNGYFEWITKGNIKIPYYIKHRDDKPVLFAGLWDSALLEGNLFPTYTFTIITTSSSSQLSFIHDRMPVILESESDIKLWLDPSVSWSKDLAQLMKPYEQQMDVYPVPREVGKVGTNDPSFIKPVAERKDGIAAMFKRQEIKASSSSKSLSATQALQVELSSQHPPEEYASKLQSSTQTSSMSEDVKQSRKHAAIPESEKMTLGEVRKPQKRTADGADGDVDQITVGNMDPDTEAEELPKKRARRDQTPATSPAKAKGGSSSSSPKKKGSPTKKLRLPPQKAKITDFFTK